MALRNIRGGAGGAGADGISVVADARAARKAQPGVPREEVVEGLLMQPRYQDLLATKTPAQVAAFKGKRLHAGVKQAYGSNAGVCAWGGVGGCVPQCAMPAATAARHE